MTNVSGSLPALAVPLGLCLVLSGCGSSDSSRDARNGDAGIDSGAGSGGRAMGSGGRGTGGGAGTGSGGKGTGGFSGAGSGGTPTALDAGRDATTDSGTDVIDAARDAPVDGNARNDASLDAGADAPAVDPRCATIEPDATLTAHLKITADNECEVFVNGTSVGSTNNWGVAVTIDVSLFLYPGKKNVIAVTGTNTSSQSGNDRGIIGELTIDDADGGVSALIVTDSSWKVSQDVATGWTSLSFDDSEWIAATEIADNGASPWGAVLGTSDAKWIWYAPIPVDTNDKPNEETTLARRTFYIAPDGQTPVSDPACP